MIRVAAGQVTARLMNEARATLRSLDQTIACAAQRRADLLVLPECAYPAYLLGSVASYRVSDHLPSQAFVGWLQERAARHQMHIVCGLVEDTSHNLYNTAVLIDDRGKELGRTRKRFLWHADRDWFSPGDEIRAFDSTLGRMGVVICADARMPEIVATLAADGAELIAMPTCWINVARTTGQFENPQVSYVIEARAREFGIPFVCADKSGMETAGVGYVGYSRIVRADGSLAAEAGATGEAVITAELVRQRPVKPTMTDAQRSRLLSDQPPIRPSADAPKITLAVAPTSVVEAWFTGSEAEIRLKTLARRNVNVLLTDLPRTEHLKSLDELAHQVGILVIGRPFKPGLSSLGPMRIGCLAGREVMSFAASRVLALDGAQVLMVFDMPLDLAILRSRALENRVFVAGVNERSAVIIGPDGSILAQTCSDDLREIAAEIDLAQSADKCVASRTDVFTGRNVKQYRF